MDVSREFDSYRLRLRQEPAPAGVLPETDTPIVLRAIREYRGGAHYTLHHVEVVQAPRYVYAHVFDNLQRAQPAVLTELAALGHEFRLIQD